MSEVVVARAGGYKWQYILIATFSSFDYFTISVMQKVAILGVITKSTVTE